ncbi:MAG: FBP domain-containing protein [Pseudolysinimonas sp.]|uniref:FBP domain-containing protein n=1 Tax=Pseudolysinimonas sp. TaxID=2680009 RepID=UPI003264832B
MRALSEAEIRAALVNAAPGEAERMPMPGLHEVVWADREYLGWRDPGAPHRGYLVFWRGEVAIGIAVRASEVRLRPGSAICSMCTTTQPASQVTMFSASRAGDAGRAGNSVGTYICADLACSLLIRIAPPSFAGQPDAAQVVAERAAGLIARVDAFAERVLASA